MKDYIRKLNLSSLVNLPEIVSIGVHVHKLSRERFLSHYGYCAMNLWF